MKTTLADHLYVLFGHVDKIKNRGTEIVLFNLPEAFGVLVSSPTYRNVFFIDTKIEGEEGIWQVKGKKDWASKIQMYVHSINSIKKEDENIMKITFLGKGHQFIKNSVIVEPLHDSLKSEISSIIKNITSQDGGVDIKIPAGNIEGVFWNMYLQILSSFGKCDFVKKLSIDRMYKLVQKTGDNTYAFEDSVFWNIEDNERNEKMAECIENYEKKDKDLAFLPFGLHYFLFSNAFQNAVMPDFYIKLEEVIAGYKINAALEKEEDDMSLFVVSAYEKLNNSKHKHKIYFAAESALVTEGVGMYRAVKQKNKEEVIESA